MINKLINLLRSIYLMPSARVLAIKELEQSERSLLEMQSNKEYATQMCEYYEIKIKRLRNYVKQH